MVENGEKNRQAWVREEDISAFLHRYSPSTVLKLLQEVALVADIKIDWNELVKNTSTGISNAREYQMIWRHLAYRHPLLDKPEDGAEPLDDDSDLEHELKPLAGVTGKSLKEAAAFVKVLIESGSPTEWDQPNISTVEAPLTVNLPNCESIVACLEYQSVASSGQRTFTVPVPLQRQPNARTLAEGLDANGSAGNNLPSWRKRKPWSEAEDMELIAAVRKFGEGKWTNIVKGDFKGDRTASQLCQRWAKIKKRQAILNAEANSTGEQLAEAQLAARHAISAVRNMPVTGKVDQASASTNNNAGPVLTLNLRDKHTANLRPDCLRSSGPVSKSRITTSKNASPKSRNGADSFLRVTAVAAGARIASPSDTASLLRAALTKNVVRINTNGSFESKLPPPGEECSRKESSQTRKQDGLKAMEMELRNLED